MPVLPKSNASGRKRNRVIKRKLPGVQKPVVPKNPSGSNSVPRKAPAGAGGRDQTGAAAGEEKFGPALGLTDANHGNAVSDDTLNLFAAADAAQAAPAAPVTPGVPAAGQPADPAAQMAALSADVSELLEFGWSTVKSAELPLPRRTGAVLEKKETRDGIATAAGRLLFHYGLTLGELASNPWVGLALALSPVAVAAVMDYRDFKKKKIEETPAAAPPPAPPPATPGEANAAATVLPPRSPLSDKVL